MVEKGKGREGRKAGGEGTTGGMLIGGDEMEQKYGRESLVGDRWKWEEDKTHLTSSAKASIPATMGADALVPVCWLVQTSAAFPGEV